MSSSPDTNRSRFRKNGEDATVFGVAVALSVGAVFQFGAIGLAAGCVILSIAAAVAVFREDGRADEQLDDGSDVAADGGFRL